MLRVFYDVRPEKEMEITTTSLVNSILVKFRHSVNSISESRSYHVLFVVLRHLLEVWSTTQFRGGISMAPRGQDLATLFIRLIHPTILTHPHPYFTTLLPADSLLDSVVLRWSLFRHQTIAQDGRHGRWTSHCWKQPTL